MATLTGDLVQVTEGLGALVDLPNGRTIYQKGADCYGIPSKLIILQECVKDLQRFLRRDKLSQTKDVFNQLGGWNIVRRDLVPLVQAHRDDIKLCYEICK